MFHPHSRVHREDGSVKCSTMGVDHTSVTSSNPLLNRGGRPARADRLRLAPATRVGVIAALILAVAALVGAPAAGAAEPGVGLGEATPTEIAGAKSLGVHWVRIFINWRQLQPTPAPVSANSFAYYEHIFSELPAGTKVILDVVSTPEWETGSSDEHVPPANPEDYANFVATLARQWGSHVTAFEIWNEEDASRFWTGAPDPAAYVELLKVTYPAVKAVDPQATVLLGGLTGNDYEFLEGVYAAGGKGYFDAVAVHTDTACDILSPYEYLRGLNERMVPDSFLAYREVRKVMLANGDEKPIWMTELSWRTTSAICPEGAWAGQKPEGVTEALQATYLKQAYHCLAQDPYVQVALWFPIQDEPPILSGLMRSDGSHKPSFTAMRDYVQKGDQLTEECGVFTGPTITIGAPADNLSYSGPLLINVSATSALGVFRIKLEYDGKTIRSYGDDTDPERLTGRIEWQGAKHIAYGWHTLTILAYDKELNVSSRTVRVFHARPRTHRRRRHKSTRRSARRAVHQ